MDRSDVSDEAFAGIYPALRRFAAILRAPEGDPDDLVQEALVRALRARRLSEIDDLLNYLRATMARLVLNQLRERARRKRAYSRVASDVTTFERYPSDLDELLRLAPGDRAVLYLAYVEGHDFSSIAVILGCSEAAARTRASRAARQLRSKLNEEVQGA